MAVSQPLSGRLIGISISESPDLAVLGYSMRHLHDATIGIARQLLAAGAQLVYGGDLRPGGFTEVMLELVATYQAKVSEERPSFINYLPLPVYALIKGTAACERLGDVEPYGRHVPLGMDGNSLSPKERDSVEHREFSPLEWATALTSMRRHLAKECDGRIILGGGRSLAIEAICPE